MFAKIIHFENKEFLAEILKDRRLPASVFYSCAEVDIDPAGLKQSPQSKMVKLHNWKHSLLCWFFRVPACNDLVIGDEDAGGYYHGIVQASLKERQIYSPRSYHELIDRGFSIRPLQTEALQIFYLDYCGQRIGRIVNLYNSAKQEVVVDAAGNIIMILREAKHQYVVNQLTGKYEYPDVDYMYVR